MSSANEVKDSGKRQDFATGSRRDTRDGKGRYDLIPTSLLTSMARHLEAGAQKYGDRNWEKGQPVSRYFDSALRHIISYWAGNVDEMHLHAALWNIMAMVETQELIADGELPLELDDHPKKSVAPLFLRVFRHVTFPSNLEECWYWDGANNGNGYGRIFVSKARKEYPHRIVCEQAYGPAPTPDSIVLHSCDKPNCVNPRHLSWGTHSKNNTDSKAKGRAHSALSPEARQFIFNSQLGRKELAAIFSISEDYVESLKEHTTPKSPVFPPNRLLTGEALD